ncbi:MAG: FAD-binding oxidoreductase [Chromatiales bacterium]|jgi:glycine/D-amino acid oxidase-like deaminating enzyme|nr:FAD-binding oxidoreductase [Chromatiales bacterium]
MKVVICGAGVIGCAIAHALVRRGVQPTLVEATMPACAASGKSGGFLALDWCDGSPMSELARRSFALHEDLGRQFGDRTGYRRLDTLAVVATQAPHDLSSYQKYSGPDWLNGHCAVNGLIGSTDTTAQVHPRHFTRALLDEAKAGGAQYLNGRIESVEHYGGMVRGVTVDGSQLSADVVVIAMGPWSTEAARWLPLPTIRAEKGASIVLKPREPVSAHALFGQFLDADGGQHGPEVFPRPDGEVYLCGAPEHEPLPMDPDDIMPTASAIESLQTIARSLSHELAQATLSSAQACYRPIVADAMPVMGEAPGVRGAYVATAHNCWGILNAPASGEAMAELICEGQTTHVDLRPFSPARLST